MIYLLNKKKKIIFEFFILVAISQYGYADPVITDLSTNNPSSISSPVATNLKTNNLSVDQRLNRIENILTNQNQLINQINFLQQQVQNLQGQVEVLNNENKQLKQKQFKFYSDLDQRLQAVEKPSQGGKAMAPVVTPISEPSSIPMPQSQSLNMSDVVAYQAAFNFIRSKKYTQAITQFQDFLKRYPGSNYVPNAHYWLGELYVVQNQTDVAKKEFTTVVKQYPQHVKVPDALLKLALIDYDSGNKERAISELKYIQKTYLGTTVADLAKAKLQSLKK